MPQNRLLLVQSLSLRSLIILTAFSLPASAAPAGWWSSPSCGSRTHERSFLFALDGTFKARDTLPCDRRTSTCFMLIAVNYTGTYREEGDRIVLTGHAVTS